MSTSDELPDLSEFVAKTPSQSGGDAALASAIQKGADELGVDPEDYATAMSYESGGTFDPWKKGPVTKWGLHRGTIQYGEPQRKQYGVYKGQSVEDQIANSNVRYLKDKGVKPGMGFQQIYAAINGGSVRKSLSTPDANTGRTIADNIRLAEQEHRPLVRKRFGQYFGKNLPDLSEFTKQNGSDLPDLTDVAAPAGQAPSPTFASTPMQPATGGPVTELPQTLDAQRAAANDPNSSRIGVLYTDPATAQAPTSGEYDIPVANGQILRTNSGKLLSFLDKNGVTVDDIKNGKVDFTPLIGGKAEPTSEQNGTTSPIAVVTTDAQGNELVSSGVSNPANVPIQAALDAKQFPGQQIQTKVVPADQVTAMRQPQAQPVEQQPAQTAQPQPAQTVNSPEEYQKYLKYAQENGQQPMSPKEFNASVSSAPQGSVTPASYRLDKVQSGVMTGQDLKDFDQEVQTKDGGTVSFPREVGNPAQLGPEQALGVYRPTGKMSAEEALKKAFLNVGAKYGATESNWEEYKKKADLGLPDWQPGDTITVTNLALKQGGIDTSVDQAMESAQNRAEAPVGTDSIVDKYGRPIVEANKGFDLSKALKDAGTAIDNFVGYYAGEKDAEGNDLPERAKSLGYRQGGAPTAEEADAQAKQESDIAEGIKGFVESPSFVDNFGSATGSLKSAMSQGLGEAISSTSKFLAGAGDYLTTKAGVVLLPTGGAPLAIMNSLTKGQTGVNPNDVLGRFGNQVERINKLSTPEGQWYKWTGAGAKFVGGAVPYIVTGVAVGGNPILTMGIVGGLESKGGGASTAESGLETVKGMALGGLFGGFTRFGKVIADGLLGEAGRVPSGIPWAPVGEVPEKITADVASATVRRVQTALDAINRGSTIPAEAKAYQSLIDRELKKAGLTLEEVVGADAAGIKGAGKLLTPEQVVRLDNVANNVLGQMAVRKIVERGIPIGLAFGTGAGMTKAAGGTDEDALQQGLLFAAMETVGAIFHKGKNEKLSPDEVNQADGAGIRVPDANGKPRDLLLLKNGKGDGLTVTDVTDVAPPGTVQTTMLPKPPTKLTKAAADIAAKSNAQTVKDTSGTTYTVVKDQGPGKPLIVENDKGVRKMLPERKVEPESLAAIRPAAPVAETAPTETAKPNPFIPTFTPEEKAGLTNEPQPKEAKIVGGGEINRDVQRRDEAMRKAETSDVTGLPNKVAFKKALPRIEADPNQEITSIDLNNFKAVNDKNDHLTGDKALNDAGQALQTAAKAISGQAQIFHLSGDEYAITSPTGTGQKIIAAADKVFSQNKYGEVSSSISGHSANTYKEAEAGLQSAKAARKASAPVKETSLPEKPKETSAIGPKPDGYVNDRPVAKLGTAPGKIKVQYLDGEKESGFVKTKEFSKEKASQEKPNIVLRALDNPITDIGQLSPSDRQSLRTAVKAGVLTTSKDYSYPAPKTMYHRAFTEAPSSTTKPSQKPFGDVESASAYAKKKLGDEPIDQIKADLARVFKLKPKQIADALERARPKDLRVEDAKAELLNTSVSRSNGKRTWHTNVLNGIAQQHRLTPKEVAALSKEVAPIGEYGEKEFLDEYNRKNIETVEDETTDLDAKERQALLDAYNGLRTREGLPLKSVTPSIQMPREKIVQAIAAHNPNADMEATRQMLPAGDYELVDVPMSRISGTMGKAGEGKVADYASRSTSAPPIVLDGRGMVVDGKHRFTAAQTRGDKSIRAWVPSASASTYNPLFKRRTAESIALQKQAAAAKNSELIKNITPDDTYLLPNGDLWTNEWGAEALDRIRHDYLLEQGKSSDLNPYSGMAFPASLAKNLAQYWEKTLRPEWVDLGATDDHLEGIDALMSMFEYAGEEAAKLSLDDGEPWGLMIIHEDARPHELTHVEERRLGGSSPEFVAHAQTSPLYEALTKSPAFQKDYPNIKPSDAVSELAAILAPDDLEQPSHYGLTDVPKFEAQRTMFLNDWANDLIEKNADKIKEIGPDEFLKRFETVSTWAPDQSLPNVLFVDNAPPDVFGEAKLPPDFFDSSSTDPENLSNLLMWPPFEQQGLRSLDVVSRGMVMDAVFRRIHNLKIRDIIVQLIPVDVMHHLFPAQGSPQVLLHDSSVLLNVLAVLVKGDIPAMNESIDSRELTGTVSLRDDFATALVKAVATMATENAARLSEIGSLAREIAATALTGQGKFGNGVGTPESLSTGGTAKDMPTMDLRSILQKLLLTSRTDELLLRHDADSITQTYAKNNKNLKKTGAADQGGQSPTTAAETSNAEARAGDEVRPERAGQQDPGGEAVRGGEDVGKLKERQTINTAHEKGLINRANTPAETRLYPVKSSIAGERAAQEHVERIGLANALTEAVLPPVGVDKIAHEDRQMAVIQALSQQAEAARNGGDTDAFDYYEGQMQAVFRGLAPEATEAGQFIQRLSRWKITNPSTVLSRIKLTRVQKGLAPEIEAKLQSQIVDAAERLQQAQAVIDAQAARMRELETAAKSYKVKNETTKPLTRTEKKVLDYSQELADKAMERLTGSPALKMVATALKSVTAQAENRTFHKQMSSIRLIKNDSGRLLAPNGAVSNLPEYLWKVVRTDNFKRYFGDWENDPENASQVLDENGEPMLMWHGSQQAGFIKFDSGTIGSNSDAKGFHFTNEKSVAATYSGSREEYIPPTKWTDAGLSVEYNDNYAEWAIVDPDGDELAYRSTEEEAELEAQALIDSGEYKPEHRGNYAGFVNLRKPVMDIDLQGGNWSDNIYYNETKKEYVTADGYYGNSNDLEYDELDGTYRNADGDTLYFEANDINDLVRSAKDMDDQGVIVRNVYDDGSEMGGQYSGGASIQAVIFDSKNFKSTHNIGSFDPNEDSILKSVTPESPLAQDVLDDLTNVGAVMLLKGWHGEPITPEQFVDNFRQLFGKEYDNYYPQIHAESVKKMTERIRQQKEADAIASMRAEEGNANKSDAEIQKLIADRKAEQKANNAVRNEHRKLAKQYLDAPIKAAKVQARTQAEIEDFLNTAAKIDPFADSGATVVALDRAGGVRSAPEVAKRLRQMFPERYAPSATDSIEARKEKLRDLNHTIAVGEKLYKDVSREQARRKADIRAKLAGQSPEDVAAYDAAKRERTSALHDLTAMVKQAESPPTGFWHKIAQLFRASKVALFQTAFTNLLSTKIEQLITNKFIDTIDIILQRVFKGLKDEGLDRNASIATAWWTPSVRKSVAEAGFLQWAKPMSKHEIYLRLIDEHPEYFAKIFGDFLPDLHVGLAKILSMLMVPMRIQEFFMRDSAAVKALAQRATMKGVDFVQSLKSGDLSWVTKDDMDYALNEALSLTYALRPTRGGGITDAVFATAASAMKSSGLLDVIGSESAPFLNFMWNTINKYKTKVPGIAQVRLVGKTVSEAKRLKAEGEEPNYIKEAIRNKWTSRQIANQMWGVAALGAIYMIVKSLGDRDDWNKIRIPGTEGFGRDGGSLYLDIRSQPLLAPMVFVANKMHRMMNGKDAFTNDGALGELTEAFLGTSYRGAIEQNNMFNAFYYGAQKLLSEIKGDPDQERNGERFMLFAQKWIGNQLGTMTNFLQFKTFKDIAAQVDEHERHPLNLDEHPILQGIDTRLPESRRIIQDLIKLQVEARKNYATDREDVRTPIPGLKIFGFNLADEADLRPEPSQAEILAAKLKWGSDSYTPPQLADERKKAAIKRDFRKAGEKMTPGTPEADALVKKLEQYGTDLTPGQIGYAKRALFTTDLEDNFKGLNADQATRVWQAATPAEQKKLQDVYVDKLESTIDDRKKSPAQRKSAQAALDALAESGNAKAEGRVDSRVPVPANIKTELDKYKISLSKFGDEMVVARHGPKEQMTEEQFNKYRKGALERLYQTLDGVISDESYRDADPKTQEMILNRMIRRVRSREQKNQRHAMMADADTQDEP